MTRGPVRDLRPLSPGSDIGWTWRRLRIAETCPELGVSGKPVAVGGPGNLGACPGLAISRSAIRVSCDLSPVSGPGSLDACPASPVSGPVGPLNGPASFVNGPMGPLNGPAGPLT